MPALLALVLAALLCAAAPARAQVASDAVGTVTGLSGPASAWSDGTPRALRLGSGVHRGETLRTLTGAKLAVRFSDGSVLTLGADSQAAVSAFAPERANAAMRLVRGILRLVIDPARRWQRFEVETRSAVAAARSTEWVVSIDAEGATAVFAVSGRVEVLAQNASVTLGAGDGTDVPAGQPPGEVKQWGQARVDRVLAATTLP
jgi:ferric-dicitrate binding protein FerR (iron transport regulator)